MQTYSEWKRDKNTKTLIVTCRDNDDTLESLLKYIKSIGNTGHTFDIVVDGDKRFEWDGDGSDAVFDIQSKTGLRFVLNAEGEPTEVED